MTSTRISDALKAVEIPDGVRPSKPAPFEQTEEYRETVRRLRELWGGMPGARIASRLGGACERIEVTGPDRRLG